MIDLRPYQHGAIGNLRASIGAGNNRVLLQAATGAGKTIIACEMIRRATDKSKRVIFIAHRKEIIHQTSGKLDAFGIDHGIIMASHGRVNNHVGLFIEGLDVPAASCCILARPTKSLTIYLQAVGRVMRPHESKTDCIILDCAGLTYEHGFVDDHREWTLNGKIKRPKDDAPAVHICEECFAAYSKAQHPHECPECGFETPTEQRETKHADVDMVELTKDVMAQIRAKRIKRLEVGKCKTLDDFIELGKLRGYKAGWAYIKWNERKAWLQSHGYAVPSEEATA
ncbi:MAG: DEAD/DEAH box helicase family protein [Methylococcales bacterium]|nr:DEAD/DEAH box helicase family protein [Methylococcales bacterium]